MLARNTFKAGLGSLQFTSLFYLPGLRHHGGETLAGEGRHREGFPHHS